jgi:hypothetical protein
MGMTSHMPGVLTYCTLLNPQNSGAVISSVQLFQYTLAAIGMTVAPDLMSDFGAGPVVTVVCGIMLLNTIPAFFIVRWSVTHAETTGTTTSKKTEMEEGTLEEVDLGSLEEK